MTDNLFRRLGQLYADMEQEYGLVAGQTGLTCSGCPENCCTSYFQHHTHVEWAYLWEGLGNLPDQRLREIRGKAGEYVHAAQEMLARQGLPDVMCPLNADGLCTLYAHRMMICRLHGVPNRFTLPNGQAKTFLGCFRCQELLAGKEKTPVLERTDFYRRLAALEMEYIRGLPYRPARVRLTLAEMIRIGPPEFNDPAMSCATR
ncbi:MAG TPA: hypothetical protein ENN39_05955 [Desulfonatronum sp.]|nr:hypothetical protein [Desulfonatronum sp.]